MKLLFLCTTEFQLLTALNIKYHMCPNDEADIIVANYHGEEKDLADRIQNTGLFHRAYYVREYIENKTLHRYFHGLSDKRFRIGLRHASKNSLSFIKMKIMTNFCDDKAYLETMINDFSNLQIEKYDAFFAHGNKHVTCYLTNYLLQVNKSCKFFLLDEGIGTYMATCIGDSSNIIDTYYCYAPENMLYERKVCKIPKIKKNEQDFKEILNYIFQFYPSDVEDYRNAIIIFNPNGSEVKMPPYLKITPILNRTLLRSLYKQHIIEEQEFHEQLRIMNLALAYAKRQEPTRKVWMKLAPRASQDQIEEYTKRAEIPLLRRWDLPWELLALNCSVGNNIMLTTCSSAVFLYNDVIEGVDMDTKRIFLYKISRSKYPEEMDRYCSKIAQNNKNIFIPGSEEELNSIL